MQRPAKPCTPVRFRPRPPSNQRLAAVPSDPRGRFFVSGRLEAVSRHFEPDDSIFEPHASTFEPHVPIFESLVPIVEPHVPPFEPCVSVSGLGAPIIQPGAPIVGRHAPIFGIDTPIFGPDARTFALEDSAPRRETWILTRARAVKIDDSIIAAGVSAFQHRCRLGDARFDGYASAFGLSQTSAGSTLRLPRWTSLFFWGRLRPKYAMQIRTHPVMPTRPCAHSFSLQGDSVFADFDVDERGQLYLARISLDGYGCCTPKWSSAPVRMPLGDSQELLRLAEADDLAHPHAENILRSYFAACGEGVWVDALQAHHLI